MEISTEAHCGAFKSTRLIIQLYLGLASSWISITKNLVAFEEKNCKKRGQEITIGKKFYMFLKVIFSEAGTLPISSCVAVIWATKLKIILEFDRKWR